MEDARISKSRFFFVFLFFLTAFLSLGARLGFIQIFKSTQYISIAKNQSRVIVEMQPVRGRIIDRNGHNLAMDVRLDSLYAVSRVIKNKAAVVNGLNRVLGCDRRELVQRINKDKLFVWIARKISPEKVKALRDLKVEGLGFVKESQRVYPKGETACQLVGFTGIDNDGLEGIELNYNSYLKGVPGWRLAEKDAKQRELISKQIEMVPPVDGYNLRLTIDEVIQTIAEKALSDVCRKFNAIGGSIVVMDPKTGDVLGMAMYPLYDLNNSKSSSAAIRRNRAVTDLFEPGSVFKAFTLSAILDERVFGLDEKFNCEIGAWAVAGKILHDHRGHGVMSFREIIEKSSNIGTVKGAMRLGAERFYKVVKRFGFGQKTGIGLAGEINGMLPPPRVWSGSSIINIPIGQGVAVTPIQLAGAMGAIANDGVLMKPRIISVIEDQEGRPIHSFDVQMIRQAISKETSLQVRSVLEGVVSRGTGKKAVVPGFKAAGKTGTAQKLLPGGGYSHDKFIASFVGFVPYDEPKLVIAVSLDEPHPVYYGGDAAAPAFSRVAQEVMAYWQISQTETPAAVSKSYAGASVQRAKKESMRKLATEKPVSAAVGVTGQ